MNGFYEGGENEVEEVKVEKWSGLFGDIKKPEEQPFKSTLFQQKNPLFPEPKKQPEEFKRLVTF